MSWGVPYVLWFFVSWLVGGGLGFYPDLYCWVLSCLIVAWFWVAVGY